MIVNKLLITHPKKNIINSPYESRVGSMLSQKVTDENGYLSRDE